MPFVADPGGELTKEVMADKALGDKLGLQQTPTIVVCTQHEWVQVTDTSLLYQTIDELLAKVGGTAGTKTTGAKPTAAKKATH